MAMVIWPWRPALRGSGECGGQLGESIDGPRVSGKQIGLQKDLVQLRTRGASLQSDADARTNHVATTGSGGRSTETQASGVDREVLIAESIRDPDFEISLQFSAWRWVMNQ